MTAKIQYTTLNCSWCYEASHLELDADAYSKWRAGASLAEAFPDFTMGQRELLMTGIHEECWDLIFGNNI